MNRTFLTVVVLLIAGVSGCAQVPGAAPPSDTTTIATTVDTTTAVPDTTTTTKETTTTAATTRRSSAVPPHSGTVWVSLWPVENESSVASANVQNLTAFADSKRNALKEAHECDCRVETEAFEFGDRAATSVLRYDGRLYYISLMTA